MNQSTGTSFASEQLRALADEPKDEVRDRLDDILAGGTATQGSYLG